MKPNVSNTFCLYSAANKLSSLYDMGFSTEDCKKALDLNKMNLTEAALWLTENVTPEERRKPEEGGLNITGIDVSVRGPRRGNSILQR